LNVPTSQANNVTTGRIYLSVIEKKKEVLGKTVQNQHTNEIKEKNTIAWQFWDYDIVTRNWWNCRRY
jgi:CTP synthase